MKQKDRKNIRKFLKKYYMKYCREVEMKRSDMN